MAGVVIHEIPDIAIHPTERDDESGLYFRRYDRIVFTLQDESGYAVA